jgi:hypothetical protein
MCLREPVFAFVAFHNLALCRSFYDLLLMVMPPAFFRCENRDLLSQAREPKGERKKEEKGSGIPKATFWSAPISVRVGDTRKSDVGLQ